MHIPTCVQNQLGQLKILNIDYSKTYTSPQTSTLLLVDPNVTGCHEFGRSQGMWLAASRQQRRKCDVYIRSVYDIPSAVYFINERLIIDRQPLSVEKEKLS